MIRRWSHRNRLVRLLVENPVVAILGARQVGKTTLAREIASRWRGPSHRFDLEDPADLARLDDPMITLRDLRGLVVLDEIQHRPELFPALRVLADRPRRPASFLVLGSASPELLRQSSESLAGRIAYDELSGFSLDEVGIRSLDRLWLRGGFPASFVAKDDAASFRWRRQFVQTFVSRDLPALGIRFPPPTMRRFWAMLAHLHAQTWNASEMGRAFGVADTTVRGYLDALTAAFVVRQLSAWHENLGKRQVKAPKVYLSDPGLLHVFLAVRTRSELLAHSKVGASWEGLALSEVASRIGATPDECHHWRTHQGAELDLLVVRGRRRWGFEFKRTSAPQVTPSMRIALDDLKLDHLWVIHAGQHTFPLGTRIQAVPLARILSELRPLP